MQTRITRFTLFADLRKTENVSVAILEAEHRSELDDQLSIELSDGDGDVFCDHVAATYGVCHSGEGSRAFGKPCGDAHGAARKRLYRHTS